MIRVLFLTPQLNLGGTEHHILKLCRRMPRITVTPFVFCANLRDQNSPISEKLRDAGIEVLFHPLGIKGLSSLSALRSFIHQKKIDIVHSFFYGNVMWDSLIYWLSSASVFITERRNLQHWRVSPKIGIWEKMRNQLSTQIIANSTEAKRVASSIEGLADGRITVIHNGIEDVTINRIEYRDLARKSLGIAVEEFVLVNVANLKEVKRQEDILSALADLCVQTPEIAWRLVLVGRSDQNYGQALKKRVHELALESRVLFVGEQQDPSEFLHVADLFVLSSEAEGFSNALLEAFAYGLPTVATRVGGNIDLVRDGANGFLYQPRNTIELVDHLRNLAKSPELRKTLGLGALNTAQYFSMNETVAKYVAMYLEIFGEKHT
jgi:glycosyltransferase involved in cell wall biosynthesis